MKFDLQATCEGARAGVLHTSHGPILTPAFLPVATQASVKALTPSEVRAVGGQAVLVNTYHLYLRPGVHTVQRLGGVHSFMRWDGPILTDSGGFQVYSLGGLRQVTDQGVLFKSHIDGSEHLFTPERVVECQEALGADIIMALDQCIGYEAPRSEVERAMERTHRWALRCRNAQGRGEQALFGIVQGGLHPDLRQASAEYLCSLDFPGYAIGGLGVGEPKREMYDMAHLTAQLLPRDEPRYLMGVGSPEDLVECVGRGIDLFDCALPTRVARNGALFTPTGRVSVLNARFREQRGPMQEGCDCLACQDYSAAYLHHLFRARELLGLRLATLHNLRFVLRLMEEMRSAVLGGTFAEFATAFLDGYTPTDEETRRVQKEKWVRSREGREET